MKFDVWKDIRSQSSYLKSWLDPVTLWGAGGDLKSWKTLRLEGSGWNLVGKIIPSPRYVIDILERIRSLWGSWGVGLILSVSELPVKSRLDPVTLGGVGGNLKSWKMLRVEDSGWNLVGKISTSSIYVIDITGTDTLSMGELEGGRVILKN